MLASVLRFFYKLIMLPRFDIHTHAFHPKIADKVVKQLENHYRIPPVGNGCYEDLAPRLERAGIRYCCIHSAATKGDQVIPANRWAVSLREHEGVIPFGTMHPDYEDVEGELDRIKAAGLKGVKLHPDFQHFCLDDENAIAMFQAMAERNMPAIINTGDQRYPYSEPARMARVLDRVPGLKVICAHLGGWSVWTDAWPRWVRR